MQLITRIFGIALAICVTGTFAAAQDVTLSSRDGAIALDGTLLSYDGEFYRVETVYGVLTLDGEGVDCTGPGCPNLDAFIPEINLSGSRLMADVLIPALIQAFAERNGFSVIREVVDDSFSTFILNDEARVRARFSLRASTTGEGYADLIAEEAQIALVVREPKSLEVEMAQSAGVGSLLKGRRARVIALDGLVLTVSTQQPLPDLSLAQIAGIFTGQISDWNELGGDSVPIKVHAPSQASGLTEAFVKRVLAGAEFDTGVIFHDDLETLVDTVADDPFAIGLTLLSEQGNARAVRIAGDCGYEQIVSSASLRTEDYPLTMPMMLYTPARRLPLLGREFLKFSTSPAANVIIRRSGFVDQTISSTGFDGEGTRLAHAVRVAGPEISLEELQRLVATLQDRRRLSTTFRFEGGATKLDVQSRENVARLSEAMELGVFDGKSLMFVGFSDGDGSPGANLTLSERRADAVMNDLRNTAEAADFKRVEMLTEAFGEALPMACDDAEWGRATNRRVEVWVK
ncbi:MAG: phosphate ABC transporter substrate-binding/OmpA family protein [Litoreibacter sp.]